LKVGRSDARETDRVRPVPDGILAATLPHLSRHVRAMVDLQLLTGARPGEIVSMRTCDINRAGEIWVLTPAVPGSRDRALADAPDLSYSMAAEILFLIETLETPR
jgi:integrase